MKTFIISYGRAKTMITGKWLKSAIIVVPKSQELEYKEHNDNEILAIPDVEDGNCAKKKNAILKRTVGEDVTILDDDIRGVGYHEKGQMHVVSEKEFLEFCENMFLMTKEMDTICWGVNVQSDRKFYREYSPFSLSSVVLGPWTNIRNIDDKIRFNEEIYLKEDYDLCIRVFKKYRKILRNNKWYYISKHITTKGGLAGKRNRKEEIDQCIRFQQIWGSKIVKLNRKTQAGNETINPIVNVPICGI